MVAPVIDEIAKDYEGRVKVYKLNTDNSGEIATRFKIRSIPTVMIFKSGIKMDVIIGAVDKSRIA